MIVMKPLLAPRLRGSTALIVAVPLLAACGGLTEASDDSGSDPRVVASFYPLQYVAERVAGDGAIVSILTTPGTEPHDLELTIPQTADVADADVLFYLAELQPAVDDAVGQSGTEHVVDAAKSADLRGSDSQAPGDLDPHFWLDPIRLAAVAGAFEEELARAEPNHAEEYTANLADLQEDLEQLDDDISTGLASCRIDAVVVSHDAFGYFGSRYGLDLQAVNGLSPEAEPSPAHLRELADLIESEGITTVFSETLATTAMADTLAAELGLETAVLDPVEGLGDATADEDYLSLMRANLAALQKANDCR
ncbi:zinc ABC transporter substrate-binding protein [soil metagenome]